MTNSLGSPPSSSLLECPKFLSLGQMSQRFLYPFVVNLGSRLKRNSKLVRSSYSTLVEVPPSNVFSSQRYRKSRSSPRFLFTCSRNFPLLRNFHLISPFLPTKPSVGRSTPVILVGVLVDVKLGLLVCTNIHGNQVERLSHYCYLSRLLHR